MSVLALAVLAVGILASTFVIAATGVWLIFSVGGVAGIGIGVALVALAVVLRPRLGDVPDGLPREGHESLFRLPDAVAAAIGTRPVDRIVVSPRFNAGVTVSGWRRRRTLELGLPLFAILEPDERKAILAHELAHYRNGDPLRSLLGSAAIETVAGWYDLIHPDAGPKSAEVADLAPQVEGELVAFLLIPATAVLTALSWIPLMIARGMTLLALSSSQTGEYFADLLAARAVGRRSTISALEKLQLEGPIASVLNVSTTSRWPNRDVWDAVIAKSRTVPAGELDRAGRAERERHSSFAVSHPPTPLRMKAVESLGPSQGTLAVSASVSDAFEAALRMHAPQIGAQIVDEYRDSLYAG